MTDENQFNAVFPSNCQPEIFKNNTAASFSTQFENPKTLDGSWEVSMKDLSFINTIQTLKNEKLSVSKVDEIIPVDETSAEHKQILFETEDLINYKRDWVLGMANVPKEQSHQFRFDIILNHLNRQSGQYLYWSSNRQNHLLVQWKPEVAPPKTPIVGVFVSDELKDYFGMRHQLVLPAPSFPPETDALSYSTYTRTPAELSNYVNTKVNLDEKKSLNYTLLYLNRMEKKTVEIPSYHIGKFIEEVNKHMRQYGLKAGMLETTKEEQVG